MSGIRFSPATSKVWIFDELDKEIFIGIIKENTLRVYDNDNYLISKDAFGLDKELLLAEDIPFSRINIRFRKKTYSTTRAYFYAYSNEGSLFNARDMLFLSRKRFGYNTAIAWEDYYKSKDLGSKEIFDVFPKGWDMAKLAAWMEAVEATSKWINIKEGKVH